VDAARTDELRVRAERLIRSHEQMEDMLGGLIDPSFAGPLDVAVGVCRAWLAEHPADDGEPVTEEWAEAVAPGGYVDVMTGNCGVVVEVRPWALRVNGHRVVEDPTRGHVRRLLTALGVSP
jgi:hypothetical protein